MPTRSNKRKVTDAAKEVAAFIGEHKAEVALRATKSATAAAKAKAKAAAKAETVAKKAGAALKAKNALPAKKAKAEKKVASESSVKKTFTLADETSRSQFRARIQDGPSFSMKYTVASKEDIRKKIIAAALKACGD